MRRILLVLPLLTLLPGLAACLPIVTPAAPWPTETSLPPTLTPTPTIVWFPPTPTNTPLPLITQVVTPTLNTKPLLGSLIYDDNFSDPTQWSHGKLPAGNIALGKNELSLVVTQARGYLSSQRQGPSLGDFYAEITASPSICRGADEYGLLLRVSASKNFYRFGLNCSGQARLDRFLGGTASSPQPPMLSGAVPPGAPSSSRMAVWAVGSILRFYANGKFLFSVHDASLSKGSLGVFARAAGADSVTIDFSNLAVYQASQ